MRDNSTEGPCRNFELEVEHLEKRCEDLERQNRKLHEEARDLHMYKWAFQMLVKELREARK